MAPEEQKTGDPKETFRNEFEAKPLYASGGPMPQRALSLKGL